MHLQAKLPPFDHKGQQAITKLFSHLQDVHNHMSQVAKAIVDVSEVSSPEQFTFVLQLAVRPIIQLKIPPHLSAPTDLKFEKERLTPEEMTEENCCNLILPRPFHPKFSTITSGGSRISHWGGGANLQCIHFSAKMYAKMKEIDPVGGGVHHSAPPGSTNDHL